ncbi:hypothetical protein Hanom_Chr06g00554101 [Helianthus anomalus]
MRERGGRPPSTAARRRPDGRAVKPTAKNAVICGSDAWSSHWNSGGVVVVSCGPCLGPVGLASDRQVSPVSAGVRVTKKRVPVGSWFGF